MPKYLAELIGANGCDYTLACNRKNIFFVAKDMVQAKEVFIALIREGGSGFTSLYESYGPLVIHLYEVRGDAARIDMPALIAEEKAQEELDTQQAQEQSERELYQKLKEKYER